MNRIAIIGAGVSGLTVAQLLKEKNQVVVYEKDDVPIQSCAGLVLEPFRQRT